MVQVTPIYIGPRGATKPPFHTFHAHEKGLPIRPIGEALCARFPGFCGPQCLSIWGAWKVWNVLQTLQPRGFQDILLMWNGVENVESNILTNLRCPSMRRVGQRLTYSIEGTSFMGRIHRAIFSRNP